MVLSRHGLTLAVAESCTGGLLGHRITSVPGSSRYFLGGVISYHNKAKHAVLGVPLRQLKRFGSVSPFVSETMAKGAARLFGASIGLAITGIAGPTGGTDLKPVGLTYLSLAAGDTLITREFIFKGERGEIKRAASREALVLLRDYCRREIRD